MLQSVPISHYSRDSVIKRDIEDGFSYVLDKKGNVMRDSLGNDIKQKNIKLFSVLLLRPFSQKHAA